MKFPKNSQYSSTHLLWVNFFSFFNTPTLDIFYNTVKTLGTINCAYISIRNNWHLTTNLFMEPCNIFECFDGVTVFKFWPTLNGPSHVLAMRPDESYALMFLCTPSVLVTQLLNSFTQSWGFGLWLVLFACSSTKEKDSATVQMLYVDNDFLDGHSTVPRYHTRFLRCMGSFSNTHHKRWLD